MTFKRNAAVQCQNCHKFDRIVDEAPIVPHDQVTLILVSHAALVFGDFCKIVELLEELLRTPLLVHTGALDTLREAVVHKDGLVPQDEKAPRSTLRLNE